jgi:hypothetical protein
MRALEGCCRLKFYTTGNHFVFSKRTHYRSYPLLERRLILIPIKQDYTQEAKSVICLNMHFDHIRVLPLYLYYHSVLVFFLLHLLAPFSFSCETIGGPSSCVVLLLFNHHKPHGGTSPKYMSRDHKESLWGNRSR